MKAFRFSLQRVLDWRALIMRTEEEKLAGLQRSLSTLIYQDNELVAAQLKAELGLLGAESIPGSELQALAAFQIRVRNDRERLKASTKRCEEQIVEQRNRLMKARKDCKVLEKLKEKRLKSWTYLSDREVEDTAAENYISKWARGEQR